MKRDAVAAPPLGPIGALAQVGIEEISQLPEYELCCCREDDALLRLLRQLFEDGHLNLVAFWNLAFEKGA